MERRINRVGMCVKIRIDGIHRIRARLKLKHFASIIQFSRDLIRIRHTGVQHHKHFAFFAAHRGNCIGNRCGIRGNITVFRHIGKYF